MTEAVVEAAVGQWGLVAFQALEEVPCEDELMSELAALGGMWSSGSEYGLASARGLWSPSRSVVRLQQGKLTISAAL